MSFEVFWLAGFAGIIIAFTLFARSVQVQTTRDAESRNNILGFGGFFVFMWLFIGLVGVDMSHDEPPQSTITAEGKK